MASDVKKAKADPAPKGPAPKNETAPKSEAAPKNEAASKSETVAKDKSAADANAAKPDGGDTAGAAPSNYSRGEGQKPVTKAYKENWNAIFAKKSGKKKKR